MELTFKILILYSHPWRFGGGETYVRLLSSWLINAGHEVVLVADGSGETPDLPGATVYTLPFRQKNPYKLVAVYRRIKEIIQQHDINIVHAQQRTAGYLMVQLERQLGVPGVITLHDIWHRAPFKKWHGRLFKRVIAPSEYIRQQFIAAFAAQPERVVTIHHGIDERKFQTAGETLVKAAQLKETLGIDPAGKVAVFAGRVTRAKGCFDFIEAVSQAGCYGLVAGDGPELPAVKERIAQAGLQRKIICLGYCSNIPEVLAAADVVVQPSYREAFGLAAVEAMLCGKPVVAAAVGGVTEVIEHLCTGLLVMPGDIAALAASIRTLMDDDALRSSMGREGALSAQKRFTLTVMTEKMEQYYRQVINGHC